MASHLGRLFTFLAVLAAVGPASPANAGDLHGIPLPRASRLADPAQPQSELFVSGRSFRDTVDHVRRALRRRGYPHQAVPVYRAHGTTVARFLAQSPNLPWRAIHVWQTAGRTYFTVLPAEPDPRPASPPAAAPSP